MNRARSAWTSGLLVAGLALAGCAGPSTPVPKATASVAWHDEQCRRYGVYCAPSASAAVAASTPAGAGMRRSAFATNPALGHVLPLLPLALAARDAGHEVVVIGGASIGDAIERVGLRHVVAGPPDLPSVFARVPERAGLTGRRLAAATWKGAFAGILAPELAAATLELARDWPPDLVIHEDSEQGSWIAAERLGHPASRAPGDGVARARASGSRPSRSTRCGRRSGWPPIRGSSAGTATATWDAPAVAAQPGRPAARDHRPGPASRARRRAGAGPGLGRRTRRAAGRRVVVTLGTMLPGRTAVLGGLLDGLATLDAEVVATVGQELDPAELGDRGAARPRRALGADVAPPRHAGRARVPRGLGDDARGARRRRAARAAAGRRRPARERRPVCRPRASASRSRPRRATPGDVASATRRVLERPGATGRGATGRRARSPRCRHPARVAAAARGARRGRRRTACSRA